MRTHEGVHTTRTTPMRSPPIDSPRPQRFVNHFAQFQHSRHCASLAVRHERRTGTVFDAMLKIRDNSLVLPGSINASFLDVARRLRGVQVKDCGGRAGKGRNPVIGLNDKVLLASRRFWRAALSAPYELMHSVLTQHQSTEWVDSEEVFGISLRRVAPIENVRPMALPFIDGRCRHLVKHRADPHASQPGDMDKRWCALPSCKDCWPLRTLPWPTCGSGPEWCWWLSRRPCATCPAIPAPARPARTLELLKAAARARAGPMRSAG